MLLIKTCTAQHETETDKRIKLEAEIADDEAALGRIRELCSLKRKRIAGNAACF
jgi:hypothetical protein